MQFVFMTLSLLTAVFLILLVLVQRGRGGGLTGALGGMGGQSAFGSKAGDLFTRITIGVAAFWIILSVSAIKVLNTPETVFGDTDETSFAPSVPSLSTDAQEELPGEIADTPAADIETDVTPVEPASETTEPEATTDAPAPAATEEAATPPEAPAASEPSATEAANPPAAESTEATPEKEVSPEASE